MRSTLAIYSLVNREFERGFLTDCNNGGRDYPSILVGPDRNSLDTVCRNPSSSRLRNHGDTLTDCRRRDKHIVVGLS
ncbi:MAG: hypothetical protein QG577_546 [Thermodesulfobacteriota bacterium]|nr:hypothetical protein [Thermodesulfobacteriota bacterium]